MKNIKETNVCEHRIIDQRQAIIYKGRLMFVCLRCGVIITNPKETFGKLLANLPSRK